MGLVLILINIIYMFGTLYYYYKTHGNGQNLDLFYPSHPWMMSGFTGILMSLIFTRIDFHNNKKTLGSVKNINFLVANGIGTEGKVVEVKQTGYTVNEEPQVAFTINYIDNEGKEQIAVIKKFIPLISLHNLRKGNHDILYLPGKDKEVIFLNDLI